MTLPPWFPEHEVPVGCLVSMERPARSASAWIFHHCGGANIRKEPAVPSLAHHDVVHLGLDVHKDTISVEILRPGREGPDVEKIAHDEESVRRC